MCILCKHQTSLFSKGMSHVTSCLILTTLLTIYFFLISCSILKGLQQAQVGGDKG